MKHGPNVRPTVRKLDQRCTVASCKGVRESRESTTIEMVWFAVDTLPRKRRDGATKQSCARFAFLW